MLRGGSRTFFVASLLLPPRVREPADALYAFCRSADDAIDIDGGRSAALARLRDRLDRAYDGRPLAAPVDRAFAEAVVRFAVPRVLPEAMLEGLAWDAAGRRYETLAELLDYAARVAGAVGVMMAVLMGRRMPGVLSCACDLGMAMQLSNIARDVGEDARSGRLYLPLAWLRAAGIDPEAWLAKPVFSEALGNVIHRLLQAADWLYQRADAGISALPLACRPGIRAARVLYAEIGHQVERLGCDPVSCRAVVPFREKVRLLARSLVMTNIGERLDPAPPLETARFLVEAVSAAPPRPVESIPGNMLGWSVADRVIWVIDLFERLERRELVRHSGGTP
jgi:15-cis-phytoene synthase